MVILLYLFCHTFFDRFRNLNRYFQAKSEDFDTEFLDYILAVKLVSSLEEAVEHQQPRRKGPVRPKMRYAHQGGQNPPIIVIHGNALDAISDSYKRYLEKHFRETFSLTGTPLRIELRSGKNPFDQKK